MTEGSKLPSGPQMAAEVLEAAGKPLHVKLIAERVIAKDAERPKAKRAYKGLTPAQTISAQLTVSHNAGSTFERLAPGVFALRHWTATQKRKAPELPAGLKIRKPGSGGARQAESDGGLPPGSVVLREARPAAEVEAERKVREAASGGSKAASSSKGSKDSKARKTAGGSKSRKASAKSAASSTGARRAQASKRVASSGRSR